MFALEDIAGAGRTGVETPVNLEDVLPFVRVLRVGGNRERFNDLAVVDVDAFAATYSAAQTLAEDIAEFLMGPPPGVPELDLVVCEVGPRELPWADDNTVRRWGATYRLISRRRPTI